MSALKDLTPLGIREEDLNLLRNDLIKFNCGPLVYRTIIDWGFSKPDGKKIIDHINDLKIGENIQKKNFTKWLKCNESKLNKDSFSDFDITTLHDFLPILCYEKIAQNGGLEYNVQINDPNSVESFLKEIKAFRNDVSHEKVEAVRANIVKMKDTMRKCIRAAGKLYMKDQTEIDEKVKILDGEFDEILLNTTHFYENRVNYIVKNIGEQVPANMLERYSPYFSVPLPGSPKKVDTSDIFQCSNLSVATKDIKGNVNEKNIAVFSSNKIFNNTNEKFIVINGGPGSGKTTLMRNMCQDILQKTVHGSNPRYDNIEQLKIPIYLECRFEQQTSLSKFLRECLKNFLSPEDDIYEAFKIVKGLVFLIDGYDEINNNCRKLVDSIIIFCRDYNVSCIVSSRVDAGNNFVNDLKDRNLNCTIIFIEPISEMSDKVNFLRSHANKMDDSIDTDKLVNSFENLTEAAKEVFSSPILLTLFISLFVNDPDSVSQMKNELSAYEAVRTTFLCEMVRKLRNASNSKGRAKDVVYVLSKFCLELFKAKKYFLEEEDYSNIVTECEEIRGMPDDVNIPSLLSCILTPEHSFKFTLYTSYQFMHSTIQEFFAAKYVSMNIRDLQKDSSSESQSKERELPKLLQILELDGSQSKIKIEIERYGNIIKLLLLDTLAKGELSQYRNTFALLLNRYFGPGNNNYYSPDYLLDLILSSDSNADIISIVSDCMRDCRSYKIRYNRHIKPMTEMMQTLQTGVEIFYKSYEITNTQEIIKLLKVLRDNSEINLNFPHSHNNYQPLQGEFYTQLKNIKCKIMYFKACITSKEHFSIVVRVFRGNNLYISTPSVSEFRFAALEGYKGSFHLNVKCSVDCPSTGSNPVIGKTSLSIEHIPVEGKGKLYNIIKYLCPESKEFFSMHMHYCLLAISDAKELLKELHGEEIRTKGGVRTEVMVRCVYLDGTRHLELNLKESLDVMRERAEEIRNLGHSQCISKAFELQGLLKL